jgi:1-acyl-sn-glycerol-3-phosphate acyltransferase
MWRMKARTWWWWPYQLWKYLVVGPVVAATTLMGSLLIILLVPFVRKSTLSRLIAGNWARIGAWVTPMPVSVLGRENIAPGQSYVVVSNHQSLFDILVLYGWLGLDIRWVMKKELRSVPGLGIACQALGHIYIDRSDHEAAVRSINEAQERITGGTSVIFFPEGTRSDDGRLKRFKKGAFRFAIDTGIPVLPVTVDGTCDVLPARRYDLRPGRSRLVIHPPISTDGLTRSDLTSLSDRVRSTIETALPRLDADDDR